MAAAAVFTAAYIALSQRRKHPKIDLRGKIVLITGGSRGLGLATARQFGSHGCIVAICARDQAELSLAKDDLGKQGIRAYTFVCDVADRNQVQAGVAEIVRQLGPIDILVNNAGIIKVGPFLDMNTEDFEQAMGVMFWGPLYVTQAVLGSMRERGEGSIVNITSIGGKVSVPHLLPYCCAKFAAVALSEGLRTELAPEGIHVTTIVPGLLRTGSHLNARFKGKVSGEYLWFAAGAATPFISINADRAARSIVQATIRGDAERVLSIPGAALNRLHGLAPSLTASLLKLANGFMPAAAGAFKESRTGHRIEAELNSSLWRIATGLGQSAAESLNEIPSVLTRTNAEDAIMKARKMVNQ